MTDTLPPSSLKPKAAKDLKEVVLSSEQDEFFRQNMYKNFGEIGASIRTLVDEFQKRTKSHENIESIADMKVRRPVCHRCAACGASYNEDNVAH